MKRKIIRRKSGGTSIDIDDLVSQARYKADDTLKINYSEPNPDIDRALGSDKPKRGGKKSDNTYKTNDYKTKNSDINKPLKYIVGKQTVSKQNSNSNNNINNYEEDYDAVLDINSDSEADDDARSYSSDTSNNSSVREVRDAREKLPIRDAREKLPVRDARDRLETRDRSPVRERNSRDRERVSDAREKLRQSEPIVDARQRLRKPESTDRSTERSTDKSTPRSPAKPISPKPANSGSRLKPPPSTSLPKTARALPGRKIENDNVVVTPPPKKSVMKHYDSDDDKMVFAKSGLFARNPALGYVGIVKNNTVEKDAEDEVINLSFSKQNDQHEKSKVVTHFSSDKRKTSDDRGSQRSRDPRRERDERRNRDDGVQARVFSKRRRSRTPPKGTTRHDRSQSPTTRDSSPAFASESSDNEAPKRAQPRKQSKNYKQSPISKSAPPMPVYSIPSSKLMVANTTTHSDKIITKILKTYESQCFSSMLNCTIVYRNRASSKKDKVDEVLGNYTMLAIGSSRLQKALDRDGDRIVGLARELNPGAVKQVMGFLHGKPVVLDKVGDYDEGDRGYRKALERLYISAAYLNIDDLVEKIVDFAEEEDVELDTDSMDKYLSDLSGPNGYLEKPREVGDLPRNRENDEVNDDAGGKREAMEKRRKSGNRRSR